MGKFTYWLLVLLIPSVVTAQVNSNSLLQEAQAQLSVTPAMRPVGIQPNQFLAYQHAFQSHDGQLELRVALRPLGRLKIHYQDPHSSAPEPNHIFPLMFDSLIGQLALPGHMPSQEYSNEKARTLFNADWAAAAVFDVEPAFSSQHTQALLVALHRNNVADAYLVFLFNDYEFVKETLNANLAALRFIK